MCLNPSAMIPQSRGVRKVNELCFWVGWLVGKLVSWWFKEPLLLFLVVTE